jgi:hypothetical protein
MDIQSTQATQREVSDVLSWQYIVLAVALALLIPLITGAPITIERAARPLSLDELELTELYTDPDGISITYPAGWDVATLQPGQFLLSNYPNALNARPESNNQMGVFFQSMPLSALNFENGTEASVIMQEVIAQPGLGLTEDDIEDLEVDGKPGALISFVEDGIAFDLAIVMVGEDSLVIVQSNAQTRTPEVVGALFGRLLDSMTIGIPASE